MRATMPPEFTLRQLSYLVTAADAGTIAEAARQLHVSASAMSDAISDLERIVGARLCIRRRAQGLTLTSSGQQLVALARQLLHGAAEIELSTSTTHGELAGPINVGCYPTLTPTILPPLLSEFERRHPRVELSVIESTHDQLQGRIESGEIDVAFVYDTLIPGNPRRARLYELPAHLLLPADHPLADADTVRLEDVVPEPLILLDAPPSSQHTLSLFARRELHPRIRHRTASYETVRSLVGRGLGYGVLVQRPANHTSYEGRRVVMKEITPAVPPVAVDIIWSSEVELPQRTRALIDVARSLNWPGGTAPSPHRHDEERA